VLDKALTLWHITQVDGKAHDDPEQPRRICGTHTEATMSAIEMIDLALAYNASCSDADARSRAETLQGLELHFTEGTDTVHTHLALQGVLVDCKDAWWSNQ
jgi:hypothetical protein